MSIDGRIVGPEEARVSVFDRGFLYGDSVYEVVRTYGGRPFELEAHVKRLFESGRLLDLALPRSRQEISTEVLRTLEAADNLGEGHESYIRIVVTRGSGEMGLDPALASNPCFIVMVRPLEQPAQSAYDQGVNVAVVGVRRVRSGAVDPAAKTGNYLNSVLALAEARRTGAFEAVMLDSDGRITEGASSNIFVVQGGVLRTPPLEVGILEGVTRRTVLEVAGEAGVRAQEVHLRPTDLTGADEAFLTSSIREIVPITRVDATPLGAGTVGEVTRRIQHRFRVRTGQPVDGGRF